MTLDFLTYTLASGAVSFTLAKTAISDPIRKWAHEKKHDTLYKLFTCFFCLSFWLAIPTWGLFPQPEIWKQISLLFAGQMLSALWAGLFFSFIRNK